MPPHQIGSFLGVGAVPPPSERKLLRNRQAQSGDPAEHGLCLPLQTGGPTVPGGPCCGRPLCVWLARGDVQRPRTRCPPCQATLLLGAPRAEVQGRAGSFGPALGLVGFPTRPNPDWPHCGLPGGVTGAGGPGMLLGSGWGRGSKRGVPHLLPEWALAVL